MMTDISSIPSTIPKSHFIAQHSYHDYANEKNPVDTPSNDDTFFHWRIKTPFPLKLYEMLNKVEEDGHADIISWQPHGRCFVIHNPKEFRKILPVYFAFSKVPSFQRQLNLYGFSRLTHGRDKGGYYHELFLRGKEFLVQKIQRIQIKGTGVRARSNPNAEPNFWSMDWVECCNNSSQRSNKESEQNLKVEEPSLPQSLQCSNKGSTKTLIVEEPFLPQFVRPNQDDAIACFFEGKQFHFVGTDLMPEDYKIETIIPELQLGDILGDMS